MENIFTDIAIAFSIAAVLAVFFKVLKQPAVLAYILAGLLVGPLGFYHIENQTAFESLSEIGITLLLFLLGLELKISEFRSVGKVAIVSGLAQILATSALGFILGYILGFTMTEAFYIGIGVTFSSTIIIVKLLSDKKDIHSLYGKITVGILLMQDFVAIFALIILSGLSDAKGNSQSNVLSIFSILVIAVILILVMGFLSQELFPKLVHHISDSSEILFIASIAWAFGIAALISSDFVGLSLEIGGFLAGLALANSIESYQIVAKVRSLRDFFITLFFIQLGMQLDLNNLKEILVPAVLLSIFVIVGKPLIVMVIMKTLHYKRRTGFLTGISLSQISEFSLILAFLGYELGHVDATFISVLTLVSLISFTTSSYIITHAEGLYKRFEPYLHFFESQTKLDALIEELAPKKDHIVIVGAHRMGKIILENLEQKKDHIIVVDFNPSIVDKLKREGFTVVFGDIIDTEIQEEAFIFDARLVILTIPNLEDNLIIIHTLKSLNPNAEIFVSSSQSEQTQELYNAGANLVLEPYTLVGKSIGKLVRRKRRFFTKLGE